VMNVSAKRVVRGVARLVEKFEARAVQELDVPRDIASIAASATLRAFEGQPAGKGLERRVETYFNAVVRRRLLRSRAASKTVSRLIAATVVEDLRSSGRDPEAVWQALEHGWGSTIPAEVLEEYRTQLCA
jgi:hypothetical protein